MCYTVAMYLLCVCVTGTNIAVCHLNPSKIENGMPHNLLRMFKALCVYVCVVCHCVFNLCCITTTVFGHCVIITYKHPHTDSFASHSLQLHHHLQLRDFNILEY